MKKRDLTGQVIGKLSVIGRAEPVHNRAAWLCRCFCGKELVVLQQSLVKSVPTSSCGLHRESYNTKYLAGQRFGKWLVIRQVHRRAKNGGVYWLCRCDCGQEREVASTGLIEGNSTSCRNCGTSKLVCKNGHLMSEWGRTPTGSCRACIKNRSLLTNYGITLEDFKTLWKAQNGKCAICDRELQLEAPRAQGWNRAARVEVDHVHSKTLKGRNAVRGLLCGGRWSGCNRKLGKVDNVEWMRKALEYITKPPAQFVLKDVNGKR